MSIDPKRIKNSRTAARAVLNIMAHYGITLTNYKPITCAQFLNLGLDVFLSDLQDPLPEDTLVLEAVEYLYRQPGQSKIAVLFQHSLRRADFHSIGLSQDTITLGDLEILSAQGERKGYRYTKIVGSQQFKTQLDHLLTQELGSIQSFFGVNEVGFSVMLYHLVKYDLYSHFHSNFPVNLEESPQLHPYMSASLYFAAKSFLLAREDIFDPQLRLLGGQFAPAVQHFLQKQGVYRISDWFPQAAQFITLQLTDYINTTGGLHEGQPGRVQLQEPDTTSQQHRFWYRQSQGTPTRSNEGGHTLSNPEGQGY